MRADTPLRATVRAVEEATRSVNDQLQGAGGRRPWTLHRSRGDGLPQWSIPSCYLGAYRCRSRYGRRAARVFADSIPSMIP